MEKPPQIEKQLTKLRHEQQILEDEINDHVNFQHINGYEKMAVIKFQLAVATKRTTTRGSEEMSESEQDNIEKEGSLKLYRHLNDEELEA